MADIVTNPILSPQTRRRARGRGTVVLDNVTAASTMTNATVFTADFLNAVHPGMLGEMRRIRAAAAATPQQQQVEQPAQQQQQGQQQQNGTLLGNPSPDEMVIQQRGRRAIPLTFSPDVHNTPMRLQRHYHARHSTGGAMAPHRNSMGGMTRLLLPTRSSPRKRLTLTDSPPDSTIATSPLVVHGINIKPLLAAEKSPAVTAIKSASTSPSKLPKSPLSKKVKINSESKSANSSPSKRSKESKTQSASKGDPRVWAKGLSHEQLVALMTGLMDKHPELEEEIASAMPTPDLAAYEDKLSYLKRNIFKSLPNTRLESKTDSLAFNRVTTHLVAFKKELSEQCKRLSDSCQWPSLIDHALMAWNYVKATPVWDNPPHNGVRKACFKLLASNCATAVKKGQCWKRLDDLIEIKNRLSPLEKDSEEIISCVKHIEMLINTGNV